METSTQITPAEELIRFLMTAVTIADDTKDLYIGELLEGRMHPDLVTGLDALCDAEIAAAEADMVVLEGALQTQRDLGAVENVTILPDAQAVLEEHESEVRDVVAEHEQACNAIDRGLDKGVEGAVTTQETTEADAIRAMLRGGDSQKSV